MSAEVYYFGVWDECGHFLRKPGGVFVLDEEPIVYFEGVVRGDGEPKLGRRHLDGSLAPRKSRRSGTVSCEAAGLERYASDECPEGQFLRHDLSNGFTAIQWWDRAQGDKRGACNSTVLARGKFTSEEMLAIFAEQFSSRKARLEAAGVSLVEVRPA